MRNSAYTTTKDDRRRSVEVNPITKLIAKAIAKDEPINTYLCILERVWLNNLNARLFPRRDWFVASKGIAYDETGYHKLGGTFWM